MLFCPLGTLLSSLVITLSGIQSDSYTCSLMVSDVTRLVGDLPLVIGDTMVGDCFVFTR